MFFQALVPLVPWRMLVDSTVVGHDSRRNAIRYIVKGESAEQKKNKHIGLERSRDVLCSDDEFVGRGACGRHGGANTPGS